ncbi:hypothetical protein BGZ83_011863 [Gryganskiella cystojenkinii]|nr:hypothetical protein BGZ83_011863 [Gryganskiella cystojenkinii]
MLSTRSFDFTTSDMSTDDTVLPPQSYLDPMPSSCILVSKPWNEILTPQLWSRFGASPPTLKLDGRAQSSWKRFFESAPLLADEVDILQEVIDKNSRHVRTVAIRSPQVLQVYQAHCTNLRVIHCEWRQPEGSLADENERIKQDIERFVKLQPCLHSLYLSGWMVSDEIRRMAASSITHFRDLDAPLTDEDYHNLGSLLPYVESMHLSVESLEIISDPLEHPHLYLKTISLDVPSLSHESLKSILVSFPNVKHLVARTEDGVEDDDVLLLGEIEIDVEKGSSLEATSPYRGDAEVAKLIAIIPNLQSVDYFDMGEECFKALAQHCPRLKVVNADWEAQSIFKENHYDHVLPPSISLLLTSCPDLESVNCPDQAIHIRHIMDGGPLVCKNLTFLRCQLVGVPQFPTYNGFFNNSLEDCRSETINNKIVEQRKLCSEAMEKQFSFVPELKKRAIFGDYLNDCNNHGALGPTTHGTDSEYRKEDIALNSGLREDGTDKALPVPISPSNRNRPTKKLTLHASGKSVFMPNVSPYGATRHSFIRRAKNWCLASKTSHPLLQMGTIKIWTVINPTSNSSSEQDSTTLGEREELMDKQACDDVGFENFGGILEEADEDEVVEESSNDE